MPVRAFVLGSLALVAILALPRPAAAQGAEARTAPRRAVFPAGVTRSPNLSPAVASGDVLYVSGQLPVAGTASDIRSQTRSAMTLIRTIVEAGGSSMENVVKCTVFLLDAADFAGMNEAYVPFFPGDPPARSTVVVAALVRPEARIEVECIAALAR